MSVSLEIAMVAIISNNNHLEQISNTTIEDPCTILEVKVEESSHSRLYHGIIRDDDGTSRGPSFRVVDKGSVIEFVLPMGTAQFAEISVFDITGNLVWKTQSFNSNVIVWDKLSTLGERIPQGSYTFSMKQGDRQVSGSAMITR